MKRSKVNDLYLDLKCNAISALAVHPVNNDVAAKQIITGDVSGNLTISILRPNQQIQTVLRRSLESKITCLEVFVNIAGSTEFIAGDSMGSISAFNLFSRSWRLQVGQLVNSPDHNETRYDPAIRCMLSVILRDIHVENDGNTGKYLVRDAPSEQSFLLVCSGSPALILVQMGRIVRNLQLPCPMTYVYVQRKFLE
ncbi:hypothetical protein HK096_010346 [Nowakowskiella sp. JEL0078]|nr:hypothetical protein HK096_010346 [Nowakowskiella sp. JEL0078]